MIKLRVEELGFSIMSRRILSNITIEVHKGEFVGLVGPNGCGKSTLLKNIYKVHKPDTGAIYIDGTNVMKLSNREAALQMSVMVQETHVEFDMDVMEMVMLGRYAHKKFLSNSTQNDFLIAKNALETAGMNGFEGRSFSSLSGGEKQRVLMARALTQQANLIILDEPTNHLDIGYQHQIMRILKDQNTTVFSSIHDLSIASYYCDKIIVMNDGLIVDYGKPEEVLTKELIKQLFNISVEISSDRTTGKMQMFFYT